MNALKIVQRRWSGTFFPTRQPPVLLASEDMSRGSPNIKGISPPLVLSVLDALVVVVRRPAGRGVRHMR